jgi:hypothetical protein
MAIYLGPRQQFFLAALRKMKGSLVPPLVVEIAIRREMHGHRIVVELYAGPSVPGAAIRLNEEEYKTCLRSLHVMGP